MKEFLTHLKILQRALMEVDSFNNRGHRLPELFASKTFELKINLQDLRSLNCTKINITTYQERDLWQLIKLITKILRLSLNMLLNANNTCKTLSNSLNP